MTAPTSPSGDLGTGAEATGNPSRSERRQMRAIQRQRAQEERWSRQRFAVPHRIDGPKVTLGVAWFVGLMAAVTIGPRFVAVFVVPAAAIAALQSAHAWEHDTTIDRQLTAAAAVLMTLSALSGNRLWFGAAIVLGVLAIAGYAGATLTGRGDQPIQFAEVTIRSAVPVALAAGSLILLATRETGPFVALVCLVSAYEAGDFLIGSGALNEVEGPAAGVVAVGIVGAGVWLVPPEPLTTTIVPFFVALTALACPLGQIFGSALLPRGDVWAPGVRRLDSYLLAAPIWLLLL